MARKMTPQELVAEYKRSGKFDRLRREAMESFLTSEHSSTLTRRVDEIASETLQNVDHAHFIRQGQDALLGTIMNDLDRFPLVDRAMITMSDGLKDEAFLRNIADEVLTIINPSEPEHRDQIFPEPEPSGVEANHHTLASGSTDPHPLDIQNGIANSVEGSPTRAGAQMPDRSTKHSPDDNLDSTLPAHAALISQSRKLRIPEVLDDHGTNRPRMNGITFSFAEEVPAPQQPQENITEDDVPMQGPPTSVTDVHAEFFKGVENTSETRESRQELEAPESIAVHTSFSSAEHPVLKNIPQAISDSIIDAKLQSHSVLSPKSQPSLIILPLPPRSPQTIPPKLERRTNMSPSSLSSLSSLPDSESESSLSDPPD